jgi:O-antigen/teichoic acid export membrane protein
MSPKDGMVSSTLNQLMHGARASRYMRSVIVLAGGTALGQGLVVLASPVLTRLYDPADFGVLAVFSATLSIVLVVASLRYETAIPIAGDREAAANLLVLSALVMLAVCLVTSGALWLLGGVLVDWAEFEAVHRYLWLLPLALLGAGSYQILNHWAMRHEAFGAIARTKLGQSLGTVATQLGLGVLTSGPIGLLLGWSVGQASGGTTLGSLAWRADRDALARVSWSGMRWVAARYRRLALLSSGSALLNWMVLGFPAIYLSSAYGLRVAGAYALGQRIIGVPMLLIGGSMGQVYQGEAARLVRERPWDLKRLFIRTAQRLFLVGLLPILAVALAGPWTFGLVFGSAWRDAGLYLQLLAPMLVVQFVIGTLGATVEVIERQDLYLLSSAIRLLLMLAVIPITRQFDMSHTAAVALLGVSGSIGYVGYGYLCWYGLARRHSEVEAGQVGG